MLRGHRLSSSSTTEKLLWSLGLRTQLGSPATVVRQRSALASPASHHQQQQQRHWRSHQYQSFSTAGTTGLVKEQQSTTAKAAAAAAGLPVDKDGNVLGSAAKEAQRLSDLASKSRLDKQHQDTTIKPQQPPIVAAAVAKPPVPVVTNKTVTEETLQDALGAAQALLFVTSWSTPLQDAIKNKQEATPDIQRQISCLHRAFFAVTSWCLDVALLSHDPRILDKALEVARRAHQLQLPFPLPLYQRLVNTVALEYDPTSSKNNNKKKKKNNTSTVGGLVLEFSSRATFSLSPKAISSSDFFQDALVALAKRRRFGDVVLVLRGMESQFSIFKLDLDTLAHLLAVLKDQAEEDETLAVGGDDSEEHEYVTNTADFLEILNLLNPYVWKTMRNYSTLSEMLASQRAKQREVDRQNGREPEQLLPSTPSHYAEASSETKRMATRRKRSAGNYTRKDELYYYRGMIYQTDDSEIDSLPDITDQIEALNQGKEFRYAEEFEQAILNRVMAEDGDFIGGDRMTVSDENFAERITDSLFDAEDSDVFTDEESDGFDYDSTDDDDLGSDDDDDNDDKL